jgi:hypothetical protein
MGTSTERCGWLPVQDEYALIRLSADGGARTLNARAAAASSPRLVVRDCFAGEPEGE